MAAKPSRNRLSSVWADSPTSKDAAASWKARAKLIRALQKVIFAWDLSQKDAAQRLGLTQPRLNDLLRGKIEKFSLDALFDLAGKAGLKVSVGVRNAG